MNILLPIEGYITNKGSSTDTKFFIPIHLTIPPPPIQRKGPNQPSSFYNATHTPTSLTLPDDIPLLLRRFTSQHHVHTLLSVGEWFDQMPIGNGHLGALVGGSATHEVIPLSTAGYYAYEKDRLKKVEMEEFEGYTKRTSAQTNNHGRNYKQSRHFLYTQGNFQEAANVLRKIETSALGMFQGSVDMVIKYGKVPWVFRPHFTQPASPPPQSKNPRHRVINGRNDLINSLSACILPSSGTATSTSTSTHEDTIHYSGGHLDLLTGLAQQTLITTHGNKRVSYSARE
ncbi:hypothetical protein EON63_07515, partial [archaeon]